MGQTTPDTTEPTHLDGTIKSETPGHPDTGTDDIIAPMDMPPTTPTPETEPIPTW